MIDLVNLDVDLFLDAVAALVATGSFGVIVMIDTSVAVVTSSISPPISVTGGKLEAISFPWIILLLLLGRSFL